MLPGFRFLFAATVLGLSVLVFGLGAAALLRAAHEDFASNPSWRTPPEPRFAQQDETTKAVLAVLSVQPAAEPKPADAPIAATTADAATASPSPAPETTAAPGPSGTTAEGAMPAMPAAETAARIAAQTDIASTEETTIAPPENLALSAREPALSTSQLSPTPGQMATPATPGPDQAAATRIATLGGPPVTIAQAQAKEQAKEQAKAQAKEHDREERRLAARRARLARQAAVTQQAFNPFAPNPFAPPPLATPAR